MVLLHQRLLRFPSGKAADIASSVKAWIHLLAIIKNPGDAGDPFVFISLSDKFS